MVDYMPEVGDRVTFPIMGGTILAATITEVSTTKGIISRTRADFLFLFPGRSQRMFVAMRQGVNE
jgi:hypothetical protein